MIFIYGLIDPRTNELRYVGQTKHGMSRPDVRANVLAKAADPIYRAKLVNSWTGERGELRRKALIERNKIGKWNAK